MVIQIRQGMANDGVPSLTFKNWEKAGGKTGAVEDGEREVGLRSSSNRHRQNSASAIKLHFQAHAKRGGKSWCFDIQPGHLGAQGAAVET